MRRRVGGDGKGGGEGKGGDEDGESFFFVCCFGCFEYLLLNSHITEYGQREIQTKV